MKSESLEVIPKLDGSGAELDGSTADLDRCTTSGGGSGCATIGCATIGCATIGGGSGAGGGHVATSSGGGGVKTTPRAGARAHTKPTIFWDCGVALG